MELHKSFVAALFLYKKLGWFSLLEKKIMSKNELAFFLTSAATWH